MDANQQWQRIVRLEQELNESRMELAAVRNEVEQFKNQLTTTEEVSQYQQIYIEHITTQICKAVRKAEEMYEEAEALEHQCAPTTALGRRLLAFLNEARDQYAQIRSFYGFRV